ncbi:MAG TPA: AgmX/PglI C-terminal domain-containing protein [Polyangiaceae bacterium]|jgi:hypothetical protein
MRWTNLLAAVVLACGGQKTTATVPPSPSATAAQPIVAADLDAGVGRIDPAAVRQVVRAGAPHFMLCYADGLKKKRDLAGRVETKFVIDETGHVISTEDVTHSNVLPDDAVRTCILGKFRNLEFPPPSPSGRVTITYPLLLEPSMVQTASAAQSDAGAPAPDDYHHQRAPFDRSATAQALGKVDVRACGFHGSGHAMLTFDPSGVPIKVEIDAPPNATKTAAGACVEKAFAAVRIPLFDGDAVTVGKNFHVP